MGTTARHTAASVTAALALFVASLFVFDRAASAALDRLYLWVEGESQLHQQLAAIPDKRAYQVLVLGSSRTFESVHPSAIERLGVKAYKEAGKGKGLRYSYEFYRLYRAAVGKPRLVIYGVDYFVFGMPSEQALLRRFDASSPDGPARAGSPVQLWTLARKDVNDRTIVRILERAQRRMSWSFDPEHNQADMAIYTGPKASRVVPRGEPAHYQRVPYARFPSLEGEYLLRLLEACAADGTVVMFVYPPDYEATRRTNFEHDAFVAEFRRLIAGAPNARFYDYDDPSRFPVSDASFFWDGDWGNSNSHLSQRGAEAFARLYLPDLARELASAPAR
jgi:hypothetical protein